MGVDTFLTWKKKQAAAVMTPEAMQAAGGVVPHSGPPPMDPAMAQGGAPPMDPAMAQGGAPPMDPAMAQGGAPPMDPAMAQGGAPPTGGAQLPPEILQDQQFIMALQQMGIMLDQASGTFVGPDGQPVPPELIIEAYQMYLQEMQAGAQGGMPPEGVPEEGAPIGGMPGDSTAMVQQMMGEVVASMEAMVGKLSEDLQGAFTGFAEKLDAMAQEIGRLQLELSRKGDDIQLDTAQDDIAADLEPAELPVQKEAGVQPTQQLRKRPSLMAAIRGN